jgi:hypothetical protein
MTGFDVGAACGLDADGLRAQGTRYRVAAAAVERVERGPDGLRASFGPGLDTATVDELVAVEQECCPFLRIEWNRTERRLFVATDPDHAAALDALADALQSG